MNLLSYFKNFNDRWIAIAFAAGVLGVYTEPLFCLLYLIYSHYNSEKYYKTAITFLVLILLHGVTMCFFTNYNVGKLFQQFFLVSIVLFGYVQLFHSSDKNIEYWFSVYLNFVYVLAVVGIILFIVKLVTGINIFPYTLDLRETQDSLRVRSILLEPGHFALFVMPSISYIIISKSFFKFNKIKSIIIFVAAVLTFSSSMYVGILISLVYRFYDRIKRLKIVFYLVGIIILWNVVAVDYSDSEYKEGNGIVGSFQKIQQSAEAVSILMSSDTSPELFERFNASTYATMTNAWVAINAPYRLVGTGLGTHQQNYESLYTSSYELYGLNMDDGYSFFIRILSEFGYIGIILYLFFLIKCYNKDNILSICFLVLLISALIKGGHYTLNCMLLFQLLYFKCSNLLVDETQIINCLNGDENSDFEEY